MHSRFNGLSITAVVLPVVLLILLYRYRRKGANWTAPFAFILCLSLGVGAFCQLWLHEAESRFTMDKWAAEPRERVWMVDDLLAQYDLIGMDVLSIERILGKETDTSYFEAPGQLVYYLGNERGLISIDSEWLVIDLNEEIATDVRIMRD